MKADGHLLTVTRGMMVAQGGGCSGEGGRRIMGVLLSTKQRMLIVSLPSPLAHFEAKASLGGSIESLPNNSLLLSC